MSIITGELKTSIIFYSWGNPDGNNYRTRKHTGPSSSYLKSTGGHPAIPNFSSKMFSVGLAMSGSGIYAVQGQIWDMPSLVFLYWRLKREDMWAYLLEDM